MHGTVGVARVGMDDYGGGDVHVMSQETCNGSPAALFSL